MTVQAMGQAEYGEGRFTGARGTQLCEQWWRPRGKVRAVVIVMHGLKDHSNGYGTLAARLNARGDAVYAFDLRGHGRSEGKRVWVDHFDDDLERRVGHAP